MSECVWRPKDISLFSFEDFNGTPTKWLHLENRILKGLPLGKSCGEIN